ncbi:MAG: hypothetical protein AAB403_18635 [Planctomycetota bacterium]
MSGIAQEHPIAQRLQERAITTIALIDDGFDPPTRPDVATEVDTFWAELEDDDAAKKELFALLGRELPSADAIDDAAVQTIYKAVIVNDALKKAVAQFVTPIDNKVRPLDTLRKLLSDELKRETKCHGKLNQLTEPTAQMVFVDYYMGSGRDDEMVKAAKDVVKEIDTLYSAAGFKPVIVLMSSANVSPQMIEDFRQSSGWLAGMFYFINKDDFNDPDIFFMRLTTFAQAIPAGHQIQALVDAIASRIHDVGTKFVSELKALHLSDYAYLQMMSLQEDGHPLGDYMLWLCGSYIGQMLFNEESVRGRRKDIDKLVFSDIPAAQATPTDMLARLYEAATVEPVESELAHPRAPEGTAANPLLHLGDIFVAAKDKDVVMILNAQCDLEFAPGVATRPFKPNRAILLIPGRLQSLRDPLRVSDADKPRTEVFQFDKEYFRIVWDPKRLQSVQYGDISKWLGDSELKLVARLRLPFALQVQQAFAADLTRVGLPTAPPIQRSARARLYCVGEDGKSVLLTERENGAHLFATGSGLRFVVADELVVDIKSRLAEAVVHVEKRETALKAIPGADKSVKSVQAAVEALKGLIGRHDVALRIRMPFSPPAIGEVSQLSDLPIAVQLGGEVGGTYRIEQPLLVHLLEV